MDEEKTHLMPSKFSQKNMPNMPRQTIYIFGNPLLSFDQLPLRLVNVLKRDFPGLVFTIMDPNENLKPQNGRLVLIDTIEGIKKVVLIKNMEQIKKTCTPCSLHDFDLGFNLKILKKIGELKKILIFGVPMRGDPKKIYQDLAQLLKKNLKAS